MTTLCIAFCWRRCCWPFPPRAFATWSVIALDAKTGQVIIASATCVRQAGFPARSPTARAT